VQTPAGTGEQSKVGLALRTSVLPRMRGTRRAPPCAVPGCARHHRHEALRPL